MRRAAEIPSGSFAVEMPVIRHESPAHLVPSWLVHEGLSWH